MQLPSVCNRTSLVGVVLDWLLFSVRTSYGVNDSNNWHNQRCGCTIKYGSWIVKLTIKQANTSFLILVNTILNYKSIIHFLQFRQSFGMRFNMFIRSFVKFIFTFDMDLKTVNYWVSYYCFSYHMPWAVKRDELRIFHDLFHRVRVLTSHHHVTRGSDQQRGNVFADEFEVAVRDVVTHYSSNLFGSTRNTHVWFWPTNFNPFLYSLINISIVALQMHVPLSRNQKRWEFFACFFRFLCRQSSPCVQSLDSSRCCPTLWNSCRIFCVTRSSTALAEFLRICASITRGEWILLLAQQCARIAAMLIASKWLTPFDTS